MANKIKVLLSYIVYPLAMATYFRKALEHRDDVDLKVTGPYTAHWIPWMGGMTVLPKYANPPDLPLPFPPSIGEINYEIVQTKLGDWKPDLVLQIDAGLHYKYKPTDGMVVTVATDPHVLNYNVPRGYSDKFFNMQKVYSQKDDIYLPYAYSKYDHYPEVNLDIESGKYMMDIDKDVDAVLIGMPYPQRVLWVDELRKRGVKVIFENGPIFDEARALYNRGRIGLNWSSMDDLNARAFELPAMKLLPVMNHVSDLSRFKFYQDTLLFSDLDGAIEQVMWAKTHPENSRLLAESAYQHVQGETYDARIEQIFKECGFA